ncbi:MAG TPA: PadR family transcriptional regulator [Ktedonobacteraceae bacterium]|nr:PadR family transcriptional regulator [Ktedonobacteraceae bacterium]
MYEFILLAQLMNGPAHGYLIAKIINDIIGPFARLSYGRLYPLLAKLEENGLISSEVDSAAGKQRDRHLRIYTLTDAGRMRFRLLMNDSNSNPGNYQYLFAYKVTAFSHITSADRLRLIDHYINHCQTNIFHLQAETEDMVVKAAQIDDLRQTSPELAHGFSRLDIYSIENIVNVLQHSTDIWKLQLEWARELKAREMALASRTGEGGYTIFNKDRLDELS